MSDNPPGMVERARKFAAEKHAGQSQKDGGPYVKHPQAVERIVREHGYDSPVMLAAAHLHDVVEKSDTGKQEIEERFGPEVADLVDELTVKGLAPDAGFEAKQRLLVDDCTRMSSRAKAIKLADRLDNLSVMRKVLSGPKLRRYLAATEKLVQILESAAPDIAAEIRLLSREIEDELPEY